MKFSRQVGPLHVRPDEEPDVQFISAGYDMTRDLCPGCGGRKHQNRDDCPVPYGLFKG